jgi:uncharacterized protein YegJ (DUF2314 family)
MAETLMDKAQRDDLAWVPRSDPDMAAAMSKARATLAEFLTLARAPRPSTSGFGVKVAIRDKSNVEYFWILPFKEQDGKFSGRIDNTPRLVKTVKSGQSFDFSEGEIVDWLYMDGGKMKGNYTACALLKRDPGQAAAFKARFGLECDL